MITSISSGSACCEQRPVCPIVLRLQILASWRSSTSPSCSIKLLYKVRSLFRRTSFQPNKLSKYHWYRTSLRTTAPAPHVYVLSSCNVPLATNLKSLSGQLRSLPSYFQLPLSVVGPPEAGCKSLQVRLSASIHRDFTFTDGIRLREGWLLSRATLGASRLRLVSPCFEKPGSRSPLFQRSLVKGELPIRISF